MFGNIRTVLRRLVLLCIPFLVFLGFRVSAEEHWPEIRSGPFEVYSFAGEKPARETMNQLEQFRHALAVTLGKDDLHLMWPVRVLIFKNGRQSAGMPPVFAVGRDSYVTANVEDHLSDLTRLLIDQNTSRVPAFIERGLIEVFATLQVSGTHITIGAPPAQRDRDWARMHLLLCNPDFAGRSRVMISNLEQGSDLAVAYRNAYQKTAAEIEKLVDAELAAASPGTNTISALALNPNRDFNVQSADAGDVGLVKADLLLAANAPGAEAAYTALHGPDASEGLGLVALKAGHKDEAKRLFASAIESESKSARVYVEAAALETDAAKARKHLAKAMELNPLWAVPPYDLAQRETDLDRKAVLLKKATSLDPRNVGYWEALAKNETEASRFVEAQKAWGGAERAATTDEERAQIRKTRLDLEAERAEHEAAERKRIADEAAADLKRVQDASHAAIHQAEDAARKKLNPDGTAPPKATEWWSGPDAGAKVEGTLQKLDCIGSLGRLVIQTGDGKVVHILTGDPGKLTVACGPQKDPPKVSVLYNPKVNKKMGTAGEAVSIEFH
jgi:Tfp pilus assembly protein PilF